MNQTGTESISVMLLAGNGSGGGAGSAQQGNGKGSGVIQDGALKQRLIENGLAGKNAVEETVHPVYGF
ncbi:MAG TPA: hypothetical protein VLR72_05560, partial [Clostridiaceae bacterium]|nr:hypothetical protein [Clostridiaceae bacterium]